MHPFFHTVTRIISLKCESDYVTPLIKTLLWFPIALMTKSEVFCGQQGPASSQTFLCPRCSLSLGLWWPFCSSDVPSLFLQTALALLVPSACALLFPALQMAGSFSSFKRPFKCHFLWEVFPDLSSKVLISSPWTHLSDPLVFSPHERRLDVGSHVSCSLLCKVAQ